MTQYDVFNGDADGICALQQLRLNKPINSTLVTGVKRDIQLLAKIEAAAGDGDGVTVLDISLDKNRDVAIKLLNKGVIIDYYDHHFAGEIPEHRHFSANIDTTSETCTSLIVNNKIKHQHSAWAVVGAFGDNFSASAKQAAKELNLSSNELTQLQQLGTYLNYNAYGAMVEDLHFAPDKLYLSLHPYKNPLDFIAADETYIHLECGYLEDLAKARQLRATTENEAIAVIFLPNEAWARRSSGIFANELAKQNPNRAHALLTTLSPDAYLVSVRAPMNNKINADVLCRQFPTGGGRKAAAGINHLPEDQLNTFIDAFKQIYS